MNRKWRFKKAAEMLVFVSMLGCNAGDEVEKGIETAGNSVSKAIEKGAASAEKGIEEGSKHVGEGITAVSRVQALTEERDKAVAARDTAIKQLEEKDEDKIADAVIGEYKDANNKIARVDRISGFKYNFINELGSAERYTFDPKTKLFRTQTDSLPFTFRRLASYHSRDAAVIWYKG